MNLDPTFSSISQALLQKVEDLAREERRLTIEVLQHLREIERTRVFVDSGYSSLWEYATQGLKYAESVAFQRIAAMRALKEHPELEEKIRSGAHTVSTVCQIHTFLKAEQTLAHKKYSSSERAELYKRCENMSSKNVTRELIGISPLAFQVPKERAITENRTEIRFIADPELLRKLHQVRDLSASRLKNPASYPELVNLMSECALDEIDPSRKGSRGNSAKKTKETRRVSAALRAQIWLECEGRCAFVDAKTGKRCDSTFGLEVEHCKPFAMGGSSTDPDNLKLLCKTHNQWEAIQAFGFSKMAPYLDPLK